MKEIYIRMFDVYGVGCFSELIIKKLIIKKLIIKNAIINKFNY